MFSFFQKIFAIFLLVFFVSSQAFALPQISSLLSRPSTGVADEYIEIQNTHCETISLEGYVLANSRQQFVFAAETFEPHEKKKFSRKETGLMLRDAGDTIKLLSESWEKVDEVSYGALATDEILEISHENGNCEQEEERNLEEKTESTEENNEGNNEESSEDENTKKDDAEGKKEENANENNEGEGTANNTDDEIDILEAEELEFLDENADGDVEAVKIVFSEQLSGSVNVEAFSLKNFSGGQMEGVEGYVFLSGKIEENAIFLELKSEISLDLWLQEREKDFSGIFLYFENSENISGISGKKIAKLDENAFEQYTKIIKNFQKNEEGNGEENDEKSENNSENTTETPSVNNNSSLVGVDFPDIIPVFQRSTTAELRWNTISCDENPCSVNLNFDSIFIEKFSKKDFSCEVLAWEEKYASCNPPQMRFTSENEIIFRLTHTPSKQEKIITFSLDFSEVENKKETKNTENIQAAEKVETPIKDAKNAEKKAEKMVVKNFYPEIIIRSDGKFENAYEWLDDEKISCFVNPCSINLNANDSYTQNDATLRFEWKFGNIAESNRKNPTAVSFPFWEHNIEIVATDSFWKFSKKIITVTVPENAQKKAENDVEKSEKIEENANENFYKNFEIPEFVLQNPLSFTIESDEKYICNTKTATCSINLALSETHKNATYIWKWNADEPMISANPRSKALEVGKNELVLQILDANNEIIATKNLTVQVNKIVTQKAKKTTTNKTTTKKKTEKTEENETEEAEEKAKIVENLEAETEINAWPLSLAGMLFSGMIFTRKRIKK